jgi:hypothetical protein
LEKVLPPVRRHCRCKRPQRIPASAKNLAGRLPYYTGRSIGSGRVEGAAKDLIGRRLKQTGARWCVEDVNRMAELCCLTYSDQWEP